jgi:hypothetical protein
MGNVFSRVGGGRMMKITGSRSDDWIYRYFGYRFSQSHSIITLSLFFTLSIQRCTRTGILSSLVVS